MFLVSPNWYFPRVLYSWHKNVNQKIPHIVSQTPNVPGNAL